MSDLFYEVKDGKIIRELPDVERLNRAMQQTRFGPAWDDFKRGVVSSWAKYVAERYEALADE